MTVSICSPVFQQQCIRPRSGCKPKSKQKRTLKSEEIYKECCDDWFTCDSLKKFFLLSIIWICRSPSCSTISPVQNLLTGQQSDSIKEDERKKNEKEKEMFCIPSVYKVVRTFFGIVIVASYHIIRFDPQ